LLRGREEYKLSYPLISSEALMPLEIKSYHTTASVRARGECARQVMYGSSDEKPSRYLSGNESFVGQDEDLLEILLPLSKKYRFYMFIQ
jgi:hypothetical protein